MADIIVDRTTYIKFGTDDPISTGIAEGSMLIDKILFTDDIIPGSFASSRFEIQIYGVGNVAEKNIKVYQVENGVQKDLFTGRVESARLDNAGYYRQIVAYDMFYFLARKNVADWFNGLFTGQTTEISNLQAFQSLLTYLGLSPDQNTVIAANFNGSIYKDSIVQFEKIALRDMLKFLLEPSALIPYINESGEVAVYKPALANSVNLVSKYDVNESVFEEYTVNPFQYVRILNVDNAVISSGTVSGVTSGLTYDIGYNPISLRWYKDLETDYAAAAISQFISRSAFQAYKPCDIHMIVSDMSIKLGDLVTTSKGVSYVSEIIYSGPMLVEQEIISRGSQVVEEVEEDYDPVYAYLDNKIGETADELTSEFEQALEDYEPSEEYTEKVRQFSDTIMNGMGLKTITRVDPETGAKILYYYAPDNNGAITNSKFVLKLSSAGFGWTDKWEGNADASSESHIDPVSGRTISTEWGQGIGSNGTSILKLLSVYQLEADQIKAGAITADKIQAGAVTVGGLGQDVLNLIEQGSDNVDVHGTVTDQHVYSDGQFIDLDIETTEQPEELTPGMVVALTFPNGVPFTLDNSTNKYYDLWASFDGGQTQGTNYLALLNANGTTNWCNVKNSTDYGAATTLKFIVRDGLTGNQTNLCELIEAENVLSSVIECETGTPTVLELTEAVSNPATGTVLKCDVSQLTYGMAITSASSTATNCSSPRFSWDRNNFKSLLSKAHYNADKRFADAYSASELYMTGSDATAQYSGTCSSSAGTNVKTVSIQSFTRYNGVRIKITFTNANTSSNALLNIGSNYNSIYVTDGEGGFRSVQPGDPENWSAGDTRIFTYNEDQFAWIISNPIYYFTPKTEEEPTGVSSVNIILENLRTSSGTELRAFELRYEPYSTAPMAIDEEAREAADRALLAALAAQSDIDNLDIEGDIADYMQTHPISSEITTWYGTCGTAAGTAAKAVTCSGFTLKQGAIINVSFTDANTATTPTLNVNSTGAKSIYVNGVQLKYGSSYATNAYNWKAENVVQFMYNGSVWIMSQTSADLILANFCADNNMTVIDGSKIYSGTVTSKKIQANSIYATDALLGNLLACYATITGRIDCKASATSNQPTTTELDAVGNALFGTSYSSASTIVKAMIATYASIFKNAFQSKLRVGFMDNSTYYPSVFLTPMGMIAGTGQDQITESNFIADIFTNKKLGWYGANAWIPGELYVGGQKALKGKCGSSSATIPAGSTFSSTVTVQLSGFSKTPYVQLTSHSAFASVALTNVGQTSFEFMATSVVGGGALSETTVDVTWTAIEQ